MNDSRSTIIDMEAIPDRHRRLRRSYLELVVDAFLVSMHDAEHKPRVYMPTKMPEGDSLVSLDWRQSVTQSHLDTHGDERRRSEFAATAISLALVDVYYDKEALRLSKTGDRIDIYLTNRDEKRLIFNDSVRLEISGIAKESRTNTIPKRVKEKVDRLSEKGGPGLDERSLVCVVEFASPKAHVVKA